jgi:hypothetical protein
LSSGYLLDTSVLSELAPARPAPPAGLAGWLRERTDRLYLSAITVAEIEQGIHKLRRVGGTERAARLTEWLEALLDSGGDRLLAVDLAVARRTGALSDKALSLGRHPGLADVAIAATALTHDLVVLTRNIRHFAALDVACADPFEQLPP